MRSLLLLAPLLLAAGTPAFTIDGVAFTQADVLDARAMPSLDGGSTLVVTLTPPAAKRLPGKDDRHRLTVAGRTLDAQGSGESVLQVILPEPAAQTANLARALSGRAPLSEDLGD